MLLLAAAAMHSVVSRSGASPLGGTARRTVCAAGTARRERKLPWQEQPGVQARYQKHNAQGNAKRSNRSCASRHEPEEHFTSALQGG